MIMVNKEKWPINLLSKVYEDVSDKKLEEYQELFDSDTEGYNDIRATLYYALNTLPYKRGAALIMYFEKNLTLNEISEEFGVSSERARQIFERGVDTLKEKFEFDVLTSGIRSYYMEWLSTERDIGIDIGSVKTLLEVKDNGFDKVFQKRIKLISSVSLMDMYDNNEISARLLNCLSRNDMKTVGDVIKRTPSEIRSIKNLGEKGYKELAIFLKRQGLELAEEEPNNSGN